ncbi:MAG: hypothetical protein ABSD45_24560 [Terriglobia bacterium]|jgi:hypothetical protein
MKVNRVLALATGIIVIVVSVALGIRYAVHEHARRLEEQRVEAARRKQQEEEAERKRQAEEQEREVKEALGDEIDAQVGYLGLIDPSQLSLFNSNPAFWIKRGHLDQMNGYKIQHLKMFMNRKNGMLTIDFGCQFNGSTSMPTRMMVRLFDANGEYITHFTTEEYFIPPSFRLPDYNTPLSGGIRLKPESNIVQYTVNLRDAAYVQSGEFGLYTGR